MGIYRAFGKLVSGRHKVAVGNLEFRTKRYKVFFGFTLVCYYSFGLLSGLYVYSAGNLGYHSQALRLSGFEYFLNAGETLRYIISRRDAAGVERTHRQLRSRLSDSLGRYYSHGFADIYRVAGSQVDAIAFCTYAVLASACEYSAADNALNTSRDYNIAQLIGDKLVCPNYLLTGFRMTDRLGRITAKNSVA